MTYKKQKRREFYLNNKEKENKRNNEWYKKNKESVLAKQKIRISKFAYDKCECGAKKKIKSKHCVSCMLFEYHPMWKKDNVSPSALHIWIKYRKPKPKVCPICKKEKRMCLANISQKYKRDINDYEWLCYKCHFEKYHSGSNSYSWKGGHSDKYKRKMKIMETV